MSHVNSDTVMEALKSVQDPDRGQDIVSLGMVQGLEVRDGHVAFAVVVDPQRGAGMEPVRKAAEQAVYGIDGVLSATVVLTAEAEPNQAPAHDHGHGHDHGPGSQGGQEVLMPGVKSIIAVASGKGGVGKSTTAVNIALGLSSLGLSVGLLDADIYGPSMPRMLGITGEPTSADGRTLSPMEGHGIKCMSMGFLVEEETPMIWRGPMVQTALTQLMRDVAWGELDVMVVDMPPGTGDAQLTMAQQVPLTGAVIVSTPQDIALADARKGLNMFRKVDVPVFGIVENMSYFLCPNCGDRAEIFGHGGAREEAGLLGMDFLGEVPLHIDIRTTSDGGNPITVSDPDSGHAQAYKGIAEKAWTKVGQAIAANEANAPKIVVH